MSPSLCACIHTPVLYSMEQYILVLSVIDFMTITIMSSLGLSQYSLVASPYFASYWAEDN